MKRLGIILLAAGASRRMGSPKQLVEIAGVPIARLACNRLAALRPHAFCIVLGAEAEKVRSTLNPAEVEIVENECWSEGMGTSIARGVAYLQDRNLDALLIAVCDQPAISIGHYESLWRHFTEDSPDIVATEYRGVLGVPAIFARTQFVDLASLEGDRGAKSLMRDPARQIRSVVCEAAAIDLDTAADVEAFRSIK